MLNDAYKDIKNKMEGAITALKREFGTLRAGRASLAVLDTITVDYYGVPTPLSQVASLAVPESRLIVIQPWESKILPDIEKAIMKSDLGLMPTNDGKLIRLAFPPLTEERRKELVKVAKRVAEEAKVAIRNIRRDGNDFIKELEKEKEISEDDLKKGQEEVQKITDSYIAKVDDILTHKEKEIMEV
ncbi:MAG: ribosome recycling factor [Deltaproteobacteria bacterium GWA2_47_9]|nr:MAG: ribosome recycling factor [Deltaproteobacteria bacterium GWA2_47_9]